MLHTQFFAHYKEGMDAAIPSSWEDRAEGFSFSRAKAAIRKLPEGMRSDRGFRQAAMLRTRKFFHGTSALYVNPDWKKLNPGLLGKGFYATADREVASLYTRSRDVSYAESATSNVRFIEFNPTRVFRISNKKPFAKSFIDRIFNASPEFAKEFGNFPKQILETFPKLDAQSQYIGLAKALTYMDARRSGMRTNSELAWYGTTSSYGEDFINDIIKSMGYDAITHLGGNPLIKEGQHRVVVGLTPNVIDTADVFKEGEHGVTFKEIRSQIIAIKTRRLNSKIMSAGKGESQALAGLSNLSSSLIRGARRMLSHL